MLSQIAIKNAKPKDKPYKLFDGGGLFLWVQPSGAKWWRFKYRFGKEKLLALGTYPGIGLAEAREAHLAARKLLAGGVDPGQKKREAKRLLKTKHQNTFEAVAREWHQSRIHTWKPRHAACILTRLETYIFPKFGHRPVADISTPELLEALKAIEALGAIDTARRVTRYCSRIFLLAIITARATTNPAASLHDALKTPVTTHRARLGEGELPDFLRMLDVYDGSAQTGRALLLVLLTMIRTVEARGAKWDEIQWDKAEWHIPGERMKMGLLHIVPLSRQALALLREQQRHTGRGAYVFPNERERGRIMSENTMLYALYRMGYHSRATVHGFRATASTILNEHGFPSDAIERQLAHVERNAVRAAYNHAQYLPERRRMMQWWADYLDEARRKGTARTIAA